MRGRQGRARRSYVALLCHAKFYSEWIRTPAGRARWIASPSAAELARAPPSPSPMRPLRPLPPGMHRGGENQPCRVPSCMERIFQVRLRSARGLPNAPTPKVAEIECNGNNTVLRKSRFAIKYGARRSRRGAARDAHFNSSPRFERAKLQKSAAGTRWSSLARCQIAWDAPA